MANGTPVAQHGSMPDETTPEVPRRRLASLLEDEETPTGVVDLATKRVDAAHKASEDAAKSLAAQLQALRDCLTDSGKLARRRAAK